MGQLLCRAWREPAPTTIATRVNCEFPCQVNLWTIKVNSELLSSDGNIAILRDDVGPRLCVVRIVVIGILSGYAMRGRYDHEESQAQQNPTMKEAACFHVLIFSGKPLRPNTISRVSAFRI